jgi:hypothetical protein
MKIEGYGITFNYSEYSPSDVVKYSNAAQSWWYLPSDTTYITRMNQVLALNPNFTLLMYRNCMSIYNYGNYISEWTYADNQGWLLKDADNNYVTEDAWGYPTSYMVDITNTAYQTWLANTIIVPHLADYPFFVGVMADNSLKYSVEEWQGASTRTPINPTTGLPFTTQQILDGCAGILNAIKTAIGDKLLMSNGVYNGAIWSNTWTGGDNYRYILNISHPDALLSEGLFMQPGTGWYAENLWKNSVDFAAWVQDSFLSGHSERRFTGSCVTYSPPTGSTPEQIIMYGYCSMALAIKNSQNFMYYGYDQSRLPSSTAHQLLQTLQTTDLGTPSGNYYKITSTSVYTRDFTNGKVLVNPSENSYFVPLVITYQRLNGDYVSSLTLPAHTAELLLNPQTWTLTISAGSNGSTNPAAGSTIRSVGENVAVYPYPNTGYQLSGWLLNGVSRPATNPYSVTGAAGTTQTLQPVFSLIPTWTLTASAGANGSVSSASQSGTLSTPLSVTFTPFANYLLDTVTLNGSVITPVLSNTVYSNGSTATQTISATFKAATWTLNASADANGTVSIASQIAPLADFLTATAIPDPNYLFDHWTVNGTPVSSGATITRTSGGSPATQTLVAYFVASAPEPATWQLSITSTSGGSTDLTGTQTADVGSGITVTATPQTGYHFVHFILDGVVVTEGNAPAWLLLKTLMGW